MGKWGWMVIALLTVNVLVLNLWVFGNMGNNDKEVLGDRVEKVIEVKNEEEKLEEGDVCNKGCVLGIVEDKITELVEKYSLAVKKTTTSTTKSVSAPVAKPEMEKFIRLTGGEAQGSGWLRLGETVFWLDTSLYGELVEASWQGWLDSSGGSLDGWVRLYDASNGRVVDGSEVKVTGQSKTSFYSDNIAIWRGQNQYYIEIKDNGGGNKMTISEPRLRLVVR